MLSLRGFGRIGSALSLSGLGRFGSSLSVRSVKGAVELRMKKFRTHDVKSTNNFLSNSHSTFANFLDIAENENLELRCSISYISEVRSVCGALRA